MNWNVAPPLPTLPPDLLAFAAQHGVLEVLPAVLEMARDIFPACPLTISFGQDAEEETHRYIALDVGVGAMSMEELLAAQQAWSAGLPAVCPPRQAVYFVLGWQ